MTELGERLVRGKFEAIELDDAQIYWNAGFLDLAEAGRMFDSLAAQTGWSQPEIRMGSRTVLSPRLAAWHGDSDAIYSYSGLTNYPRPWTPVLAGLRDRLNALSGAQFNSVLLNYYRNGQDSMGWHQDNERELGSQPVIASISLGESRRFLLKHRQDRHNRWQIVLTHGSALVMAGDTQQFWRHALPKSAKANGARINLTFRRICT